MATEKRSELKVTLKAEEMLPALKDFPINVENSAAFKILLHSIEVTSDELVWATEDAKVIHANRSTCQKLGYDYEELIGKHIWELDPLFPREVWPTFWEEIRVKKEVKFESQHRTAKGVVFPVEITAHHYVDGDTEYLVGFARDLSDIKNRERLYSQSEKEILSE